MRLQEVIPELSSPKSVLPYKIPEYTTTPTTAAVAIRVAIQYKGFAFLLGFIRRSIAASCALKTE